MSIIKEFPVLKKINSRGKVQLWKIWVEQETFVDGQGYLDVFKYVVEYGQEDGKFQKTEVKVEEGKNVGKSNETSPKEQAILEAESKWTAQKDKGYGETAEVSAKQYLPMLAKSFSKDSHNIKFPCLGQPKLDGCVSGDTFIETKEGFKPIKWLVDNKVYCDVLSYNTLTGKSEFKKIKNHFKNKKNNESIIWYEIELESGEKIILTGNHMVFLPELNCWRRTDELRGNENLMVF